MPPRLQPESLLSLSRQCLVGLLLRNSRRVIGKGDATSFREEWAKWLEMVVALLTPDLTNTIVAEVMDVMVVDKKLRGMKDHLLFLSFTLFCKVVFLVPEPIKSATQIIQCCHHVLLGQVLSGLGNLHTCSLLAPLLSPRLTVLHFPDSPALDLPQTELVELFQRLPTCSSLQKLHFGAKVNIADNNPPPHHQHQLKDERKGQTYHRHVCFLQALFIDCFPLPPSSS